jgi:hypothetical protein
VDDGRSVWAVIFDVCLGRSAMLYGHECNWKKGVLCTGALYPILIFLILI